MRARSHAVLLVAAQGSDIAQERALEHRAEFEGEMKLKDAEIDGLSAKVRVMPRSQAGT